MAHTAVHFTVGAAVAAAWALPSLIHAWRRGEPLAASFRGWWALTWILGVLAVMPPLLRRAGLPESWCESVWMNFFLLHPLIARLPIRGGLAGPLMLLGVFGVQYALLLAALIRSTRHRPDIADTAREPSPSK